jgi:hypothetical protein
MVPENKGNFTFYLSPWNYLTPWSTVLVEKLIVTQLVKKFPTLYGT